MCFIKKARVVLAGFAFLFSFVFLVQGQVTGPFGQATQANSLSVYGSNTFWLQLISISNNTASFIIHAPMTATNTICNLFFTTNPVVSSTWNRVARCEPGQTSPVVTNLPPAQGFFMLGSCIRSGFDQQNLPANDDGSTGLVPLPFTINFLGNSESGLYVNNNGNVTFNQSFYYYTPGDLASTKALIIAPFWADVDTRNPASSIVLYGTNVVQGRMAFGVDWVNVGYYNQNADKLLSCQLVIIDRSDIAPGNFDMEFNYDRVEWEAGDASDGIDGIWQGQWGGSARAGFSDGVTDYELPGSGIGGSFLDTNTVTGLVYNSLNTTILGRYLFYFRNGQPLP
ncbi:MAG: nidogen-like domain-containing protein [Verrucomicrobiia bacterium]